MKVIITYSLWPIYLHHLGYSREYADSFQYEIDRFIVGGLRANPMIGHLYHEPRNIRSALAWVRRILASKSGAIC